MAIEDKDVPPSARRLRMRRGNAFTSGGAGASTRSESLRDSSSSDVGDEVDDLIDPAQVTEHVRTRARNPMPPPSEPARRLEEVRNAGSVKFAKEHRLTLLHKFLTRGLSLDVIARQLNVSISTLEKDRVELKTMLRERARELHIDEMIGGQTAFYDDVTAMSMRIASFEGTTDASGTVLPGNPLPMRLAAMRTALAANADKNRFYNTAGVYDVQRYRRAEDGNAQSDVQALMQSTAEMFAALREGSGVFRLSDTDERNDDLDGPMVEL